MTTTPHGGARARWEPVILDLLADGQWHRPTVIARTIRSAGNGGALVDSINMILHQLKAEGTVEPDRADGNPPAWRLRR